MIDIRKLKELVRLMVANELTELDLRDSEEQVTLRRQTPNAALPVAPGNNVAHAAPPPVAAAPAEAAPAPEADSDLLEIQSPMVGTFYSRPDPDADVFVKEGSRVSGDTVVCLIEAMKIFNEVKAELSGTIQQMLVNSGDAVEFGQPLFTVKPD